MMFRLMTLIAAGMVLGGCSLPTASLLDSPANSAIGLRSPSYTPVASGVKSYAVVEPKDWIEQNRQVGPQGSGDNAAESARRGR